MGTKNNILYKSMIMGFKDYGNLKILIINNNLFISIFIIALASCQNSVTAKFQFFFNALSKYSIV